MSEFYCSMSEFRCSMSESKNATEGRPSSPLKKWCQAKHYDVGAGYYLSSTKYYGKVPFYCLSVKTAL